MIEKQFAIEDIRELATENSDDMAYCKIWALASGNNSHKNPISVEVLKEYAHTILGKWVIADYSDWKGDFTTHTAKQVIVGVIPKDSEITFEEKDGKTFLVVEAVMSKLYAKNAYLAFVEDNQRSVSCEFLCQEADEDENGNKPILSYDIKAVTILGKSFNPSVAGAEMTIVKFSEEQAERFYKEHNGSMITKFAEERRLNMEEKKTYKINKTELKDTPWGDVDKTELRNKVMGAKNKATLVKSVYALVESGWEDAPSEHLKYPLMQLVDDTFYYNRYALASALAYAKQEGEQSVINKVEKLYDKFKLDKEEGEEEMVDVKEFAVNIGDLWSDIYRKLEDKYPDRDYGSIYRIEGIYQEDGSTFAIIRRKDEEKLYKLNFEISDEEGIVCSDEVVEVECTFVEKEEVKKFEEPEDAEKFKTFEEPEKTEDEEEKDEDEKSDDEDEKEDGEESEKEFSLDANVDVAGILAMLEEETEDLRNLAVTMFEAEDKNIIMSNAVEMIKELAVLRKYKADKEAEIAKMEAEAEEAERLAQVEKIMAEVKDDISEKEFSELLEEGKSCTSEQINLFANKVKAFAYEASKSKEKPSETQDGEEGIIKFGFDWNNYTAKQSMSAEDIFNKYK